MLSNRASQVVPDRAPETSDGVAAGRANQWRTGQPCEEGEQATEGMTDKAGNNGGQARHVQRSRVRPAPWADTGYTKQEQAEIGSTKGKDQKTTTQRPHVAAAGAARPTYSNPSPQRHFGSLAQA